MVEKLKVSVIGSGNWGSCIARICAENTASSDMFEKDIRMWVFEELVNGRKLTEIINEQHENIKYLPNIKLPTNLIAIPDVVEAAKDANILVFVLPHQFVYKVCESLKGVLSTNCRAISLIKGLDLRDNELALFSEEIERILDIPCAALSGANIASEVAEKHFGEATVACRDIEKEGPIYVALFNTNYFDIRVIGDWRGLQVCGALKNVVAVASGIVDGLRLGNNTKAAVIRQGLLEMRRFGKTFFGGVHTETFFESCGVADLITTCAGGRNRRVTEAFVLTGKPIDELEKEMLNGQKLQGTITAAEIYEFLSSHNMTREFPLFTIVYRIIYEKAPPSSLIENLRTHQSFDK
ncbi:glycerol-3-phosphate dehydrogenase [NAD+] [Halteromyces radiatus]|uniref:glycerol-3-phosphate dehydrogenase [NAD+] n=1 Tax=Halteromyces radiatus TaxID=101107 RepID=UPI002220B7A6|nr:glycerol-3-phosphate dehydrogenase [NAD+] [Halteromyces radiatus]KAI8096197.1 glycerol-3-phosphate dehydrogenase [NAD+] [Halteromyces radiatus]